MFHTTAVITRKSLASSVPRGPPILVTKITRTTGKNVITGTDSMELITGMYMLSNMELFIEAYARSQPVSIDTTIISRTLSIVAPAASWIISSKFTGLTLQGSKMRIFCPDMR
jgi:hypothetical protein